MSVKQMHQNLFNFSIGFAQGMLEYAILLYPFDERLVEFASMLSQKAKMTDLTKRQQQKLQEIAKRIHCYFSDPEPMCYHWPKFNQDFIDINHDYPLRTYILEINETALPEQISCFRRELLEESRSILPRLEKDKFLEYGLRLSDLYDTGPDYESWFPRRIKEFYSYINIPNLLDRSEQFNQELNNWKTLVDKELIVINQQIKDGTRDIGTCWGLDFNKIPVLSVIWDIFNDIYSILENSSAVDDNINPEMMPLVMASPLPAADEFPVEISQCNSTTLPSRESLPLAFLDLPKPPKKGTNRNSAECSIHVNDSPILLKQMDYCFLLTRALHPTISSLEDIEKKINCYHKSLFCAKPQGRPGSRCLTNRYKERRRNIIAELEEFGTKLSNDVKVEITISEIVTEKLGLEPFHARSRPFDLSWNNLF